MRWVVVTIPSRGYGWSDLVRIDTGGYDYERAGVEISKNLCPGTDYAKYCSIIDGEWVLSAALRSDTGSVWFALDERNKVLRSTQRTKH